MTDRQEIIPVIHCFNNNYVIPAAVSFLSMLEHADPAYFYKLYVLHTGITEENQQKLHSIVDRFDNASLEFIDMEGRYEDLFRKTKTHGHYSKEIYYKFLPPSLFPQYDKAIITDVDVVFLGDISKEFIAFDTDSDDYLAGVSFKDVPSPAVWDFVVMSNHGWKNFPEQDRDKILIGAGYMIYNLKKMRQDNMHNRFIEYAKDNFSRLLAPEQDVINVCCYPRIKMLPISSMMCTFFYELMDTHEIEAMQEMTNATVQLHYATNIKPWTEPNCSHSKIWFEYLLRTPFFDEQMDAFSTYLGNRKVDFKLFGIPLAIYKKRRHKEELKLFGFIKLKGRQRTSK